MLNTLRAELERLDITAKDLGMSDGELKSIISGRKELYIGKAVAIADIIDERGGNGCIDTLYQEAKGNA